MRLWLLVAAVTTFTALAAGVLGAVEIGLGGAGASVAPGSGYLDANLTVSYNEYIPKTAWLKLFIDSDTLPRELISLETYLHDPGYFTYPNQTFGYVVNGTGYVMWSEYPEQQFQYTVAVTGQCGGSWCNNSGVDFCQCESCSPRGPPYPCSWAMSTGQRQASVNGDPEETGLKFIFNSSQGGIPKDTVADSVRWSVQKSPASPAQVDVDMRAACGVKSTPDPLYDGQSLWPSGWIVRYISTPTSPCRQFVEGTFDCRVTIMPFDEASLAQGYRRFGGPDGYPGGGIYKTNGFVTDEYQARGAGAEWNGTGGQIILKNFEADAWYAMVYLPPAGPLVCAYTSYSLPRSMVWSGNASLTGSAGFGNPYTRMFTGEQLLGMPGLAPPDCPVEDQLLCQKEGGQYAASESSDPSGAISLSYAFTGNLTVRADLTKRIMTRTERFTVPLAGFRIGIDDISGEVGNHSLRAVIDDGGTVFGSSDIGLYVCMDSDGDGYCVDGGDCDDSNPNRSPGREEVCDGVDNNCDGTIDEGIIGMGENIGAACNNWNGSVCKGTYVCSADGTMLVCKSGSGIYPGERNEVCRNFLDDDCDGLVDEEYEYSGTSQVKACVVDSVWCIEGQTRECGSGQCRDGLSRCINGVWGPCAGARTPQAETCNRLDDDCDGIVDNVFGKASRDQTKCGCFDGAWPGIELCNGIDDDCDGDIDEGANNCCISGETRECGETGGKCEPGIQTCRDGQWSACAGAVLPDLGETCCNDIDDDCDGETDEGCPAGVCPGPGSYSMFYWTLVGIGVLMLIGVLVYVEFKKKPEY